MVMGMLERCGPVVTMVIDSPKKATLQSIVKDTVFNASRLYTDALRSCDGFEQWYRHQVVDHAICFVEGNVRTNGMENYWSFLKRIIKGKYVAVEPFHLHRYLDEQSFRFNERRVTYKKLTGK